MSQSETLNLLNEFKNVAAKDRKRAVTMLTSYPALARALLKIELHFGMVHSLPILEKTVPRKTNTPDVKTEPPKKIPKVQTHTIQQNTIDPRVNPYQGYYQQPQVNYYVPPTDPY